MCCRSEAPPSTKEFSSRAMCKEPRTYVRRTDICFFGGRCVKGTTGFPITTIFPPLLSLFSALIRFMDTQAGTTEWWLCDQRNAQAGRGSCPPSSRTWCCMSALPTGATESWCYCHAETILLGNLQRDWSTHALCLQSLGEGPDRFLLPYPRCSTSVMSVHNLEELTV